MSENLDLVRSIFAEWERGDFSSAVWAHEDIELLVIGGTFPGSFHGTSEMAGAFREFAGAWDSFSTNADQYRELDAHRVLVLVHDAGRGKASGVDIGSMLGERAVLFDLDHRRVGRLTIYWDRALALADLGLEE
jgi:hypothetical protein